MRAHHLAAGLVGRQLEGRAAFDRDVEVGAERGGDTALRLARERGDRVLRPLRRPLEVLPGQAPVAHAGLDRGDLAVRLAGLAHGVDVGEAVRPLEVGDDDHLVRADHRPVQVGGRRHREAHVRAAAPHLHLVVHDHGPGAALDADLGDCARLVLALVVADDRDDVALLDGEADVDDQRGVLEQIALLDNSGHHSPHPLCGEHGQHFLREPLHLRELVDRAEPADEVVDAGLGERPDPLGDLIRGADRAPVRQIHRLATARGSTWRCSRRTRSGPPPRSRRCSSSPGTRSTSREKSAPCSSA